MENDTLLIEQWQAGDQRAAAELYNRHRDRVFRLAYGLLGQPADAEEVAQDVLLYALANVHRYDPARARFTTWLHTIAVSRCRDRQRRKRLPHLPLLAWLKGGGDAPDPTPTPEHEAAAREQHSQLWQAVQALPPTLREAVVLRFWAGHTFKEMADILQCPVATAQSRVRLAYPRLRATLASRPADGWSEEAV